MSATPPAPRHAIIDLLNREFAAILRLPDIQEKHTAVGALIAGALVVRTGESLR